jgi:HAD superfamily hydrolase (TIGR01493 family)
MAEVVSFDMDGTLIHKDYVNHVWLEGIPRIVAARDNISLAAAKDYVGREYQKIGEDDLLWYNIHYWIQAFELECHWRDLLLNYRHLLRLYPEVPSTLRELRDGHRLIIISNAAREFIQVETETLGLTGMFDHIFSAVTDFQTTKKHPLVYKQICDILQVEPSAITHVGDSWEFDYQAPIKAGIRSYYLDRDGTSKHSHTVHDLEMFARRVLQ